MNPSGTAIDEDAISRLQQTSCRCQVYRDDFSISSRTDAVPSYGSGIHSLPFDLRNPRGLFFSRVSRPDAISDGLITLGKLSASNSGYIILTNL